MKKLFLLMMAYVVTFTLTAQNTQAKATIIEYGNSITLEAAQKIMNAAKQESVANGWTMAIAIVDTGGNLVLFERMDNTQIGSIDICIGKAKTANNFKRSTKVLEDAIAGGGLGLRLLGVSTMTPLEGGELILQDGKIIGAIGVSGMQSSQDGQVARAGVAALKK